MTTRIIGAAPSELAVLQGRDLLESIRVSGGRTIAADVVAFRPPLIDGVCNANLAGAFGADIVHLNHYDVDIPLIAGIVSTEDGVDAWKDAGMHLSPTNQVDGEFKRFLSLMGMGVTIRMLRRKIGRVVGVSLEAVTGTVSAPAGRQATPATAEKAISQGAAYIMLIGTPHIALDDLCSNVTQLRTELGSEVVLVAGKMPWGWAGGATPTALDPEEVKKLVDSGTDILLLPAPGTCPGASLEGIIASVAAVHNLGALAAVAIGSSQESADPETVRRLALDSKMTEADIYQIGDGGFGGMAVPENILTFAATIKGRRHTYRRMALTQSRP